MTILDYAFEVFLHLLEATPEHCKVSKSFVRSEAYSTHNNVLSLLHYDCMRKGRVGNETEGPLLITGNMHSHTSMISPDVIHPNSINTTSEMGTAMNTHSTSKAKTSTYNMSIIQLMHRPRCTSIVSQLK